MKILFFLEYYPPYLGSDRTIFELSKRFKGKKSQIYYVVIPPLRTLWEINQIGFKSDRVKKFYNQHFNLGSKSVKDPENVFRIQIPWWLLKFWKKDLKFAYFLTSFFNLIKSISIFRKIKPQMIIINHPSPSSGLIALLLCKAFRKPFLMGFPDMISTYAMDLIELSSTDFLSKMLKRLESFLLRHSPKIFTINDFLKNYLISINIDKDNIAIIPNGVSIQIFDHKKSGLQIRENYSLQNAFIVLYVGHIEKWAGVQEIISAASLLEPTNPDIKFLFVGDGMLRSESTKKNTPKNVIFAGPHPHLRIPDFIACSNVTISAFPNSITTHAASPLKIFEYMAMEKPVITTYVDGLKDVLIDKENGIIIPSNAPKVIAEAIIKLKNSKELAQKLGKNALKTIQRKYTWEKSTNKLKEFCKNYYKDYYNSK